MPNQTSNSKVANARCLEDALALFYKDLRSVQSTSVVASSSVATHQHHVSA